MLRLCGAQPDRYDPRKWHTPQGVLSVTGAKFMNWNCGRGGGGAIDLVMHLHQLGFGQALEWLEAILAPPRLSRSPLHTTAASASSAGPGTVGACPPLLD